MTRHVQMPATHVGVRTGQTLPHVPQLFGSVCLSTHDDVQHALPPVHALPHAPQLAGSVSTAVQTPLQTSFGCEQPPSPAFGSLYGLASGAGDVPESPLSVTPVWWAPGPSIRGVLASPQPTITKTAENPRKTKDAIGRFMGS